MENLPTPLEEINHPLLEEKEIRLYVKRDDLIHPQIMGNKWRKLKYNLLKMEEKGLKQLLTMGGAFSNHIAAVAAAAHKNKLTALGLIRGDELNNQSNETLARASELGMQFDFLERGIYRKMRENPEAIVSQYPDHYFLPEGGTNDLAIQGCTEIIPEINAPFDVIVTPIGTGGTMAGLIKSSNKLVLGVSSLKGSFIHKMIAELLNQFEIPNANYQIIDDYHFRGYGKTNPQLIDFMNWFKEYFDIPLDPIYTGKSFFTVWNMIKTDKFERNLGIVLLHTGGLQGISGFNRKNKNIIQ
ncbi:MAG: pyridoxal-phosphate dependent enzyme [Ekhidna sp.]|nr:pyridoxal-phosphate dependent enzyme [Ekhidna sp.]